MNKNKINDNIIVIRGAGDLATACAVKLHNSGFPVVMLEIEKPTVIRTTVSFASAVYKGNFFVEGVESKLCLIEDAEETARKGTVAVVVDPEGKSIKEIKPQIVIDAILAKKNLGTSRETAPFTIALGPGFSAPQDVNAVVETMRGHDLGRIIRDGSASPDTGVPGQICGYGKERVIKASCNGLFKSCHRIGELVQAGETVALVDETPVKTEIEGKLRGMLSDGLYVTKGFKVADVDPRGRDANHITCSDKARSIAGGVLEAVMHYLVFGE